MEQYDINIHNAAEESLSAVVIVLLIIFFPIGIIVFICRSISKLKTEKIERQKTKMEISDINTTTSTKQTIELERWSDLRNKGIITEAEFNAKKEAIMYNKKFKIKQ